MAEFNSAPYFPIDLKGLAHCGARPMPHRRAPQAAIRAPVEIMALSATTAF